MSETLFCRDCRHAERENNGEVKAGGSCLNKKAQREGGLDLVTGRPWPASQEAMSYARTDCGIADYILCGPDALWFEPMFAHPDAQAAWVAAHTEKAA